MRVALLTQDDPFYLAEAISGFIDKVSTSNHTLITAIVSDPSPFGKKESFLKKTYKTYKIFGLIFFIHYSLRYINRRFILKKSVTSEILKKNVPLWRLSNSINSAENIQKLKDLNIDVIVIIAGNQIIKKEILDIPTYGVINAHSSLLPKYKGLMPSFWALKNNDNNTGVTVFFLNEGIDDGPIINQEAISIEKTMSQENLIIQCKEIANKLLLEALDLIEDKDFRPKPNEGDNNYYKFPTRKDVIEFKRRGKKFF